MGLLAVGRDSVSSVAEGSRKPHDRQPGCKRGGSEQGAQGRNAEVGGAMDALSWRDQRVPKLARAEITMLRFCYWQAVVPADTSLRPPLVVLRRGFVRNFRSAGIHFLPSL